LKIKQRKLIAISQRSKLKPENCLRAFGDFGSAQYMAAICRAASLSFEEPEGDAPLLLKWP
jgi:hypothetical protein